MDDAEVRENEGIVVAAAETMATFNEDSPPDR